MQGFPDRLEWVRVVREPVAVQLKEIGGTPAAAEYAVQRQRNGSLAPLGCVAS